MMLESIFYRTQQFWNALSAKPGPEDLELVRNLLTPAQMGLFSRMQTSEQVHSIAVMKRLSLEKDVNSSQHVRSLLEAALLHDVGKSRYPLRLWERVMIVLAIALFPRKVTEWGSGEISGWQRVFVISEQHPEWSAQMAEGVGTMPLAVELIRQHQNHYPANTVSIEGRLLERLQIADQNN